MKKLLSIFCLAYGGCVFRPVLKSTLPRILIKRSVRCAGKQLGTKY